MSAGEDALSSAISKVLAELPHIEALKDEQRTVLKEFIDGKDVMALLPTGFGKSLIYQIAPLVVKEMGEVLDPIIIVVSPLIALMEDQIREAELLGISAMQLGRERDCDKWLAMLSSPVYQTNLVGIVVDEVHVTYKWGKGANGNPAFREIFSRLGELRSVVKEGTPVMALTASAETVNRDRVTQLLHMNSATRVTVSPNRDNIRLGLKLVPRNDLDCMKWLVTEIREKGLLMSPVIIYCKSLKTVGRVFCRLKSELGDDAWVGRDKEHKAENMLIGMYHSQTLQQYKDRVLTSFTGESSCRVVVATTALGLGVNFPNVSHVVMYGAPEDVEAIVQQVGRAGRNSLPSYAVLYAIKGEPRVDKTVSAVIQAGRHGCFRKALYGHFDINTKSLEPGHLCCTHCHATCLCASDVCVEPVPTCESVETHVPNTPLKSRDVTEDDRDTIRACLQQYRRTLVPDVPLVTNKTVCSGFGTELIEAAVNHSPYIFDISYITNNLPVFRLRHAQEILLVISEVFCDFEYSEQTLPDDSFLEPDIDFTGYFDESDDDLEVDMQQSTSSEST